MTVSRPPANARFAKPTISSRVSRPTPECQPGVRHTEKILPRLSLGSVELPHADIGPVERPFPRCRARPRTMKKRAETPADPLVGRLPSACRVDIVNARDCSGSAKSLDNLDRTCIKHVIDPCMPSNEIAYLLCIISGFVWRRTEDRLDDVLVIGVIGRIGFDRQLPNVPHALFARYRHIERASQNCKSP